HNFHEYAHNQCLDSYDFPSHVDDESVCLLMLVLLSFAYVQPHNSRLDHSPFCMSKMLGIFRFSGYHFHVKYITLYFIFIKCVLCEAVGSADQNHKTFKTFLFFSRKKKQKNLPSATSAKGGFALVLV